MSESSNQSNPQHTPPTVIKDFDDSGFFENDIENTLRADYKDWTLYDDELVDIDTSQFFADIDASIIPENRSVYERSESENSTLIDSRVSDNREALCRSKWLPYDPVHEAVQEAAQQVVREALKQVSFDAADETSCNSNVQSQRDFGTQDPKTLRLTPLEMWACTRHPHEYIAYLLEQPPTQLRDFEQWEDRKEYTEPCSGSSDSQMHFSSLAYHDSIHEQDLI
jgi:hypothetical protein